MFDFASKLVVVSGPSGAGKDTVVKGVLDKDDSISLAVSATTRAVRGTEQDGVDYYFLNKEVHLSADRLVSNCHFSELVNMTAKSDSFFCNSNLVCKNSSFCEKSLLINICVAQKLSHS